MKILTGTPRENEIFIEEMIRSHDASKRKLWILVPSEYTLEMEKMIFRVTDTAAIFDLSVASVKQFISRLTGKRPSDLPAALVRMILGRALDRTKLYQGLVSEGVEISLADFVRRWREKNPRSSLPEVCGGELLREKMMSVRTAIGALLDAEEGLLSYEELLLEAVSVIDAMPKRDETILVRGIVDGMKECALFRALDKKYELILEVDLPSEDYVAATILPLPEVSKTALTADVFTTSTVAWEEVAAWIMEDLKSGIDPEEITVHVENLDAHIEEAGRIFSEFGIGFAIDKRYRAEEFPLGRFFHGALNVLKDRTGLALEVFSHLPYGQCITEPLSYAPTMILDQTTPIVGPYFEALDKAVTFGDVIEIYAKFIAEPIFLEAIEKGSEENERVWNAHIAELRAYHERFGNEPMSSQKALERILSGLKLLDVGVLPIEGNLVRITSLGRVLGTAKVRYLMGLSEDAMCESDARFFFGYDEIKEGRIAIPNAEENDRKSERELNRLLSSAERVHITCATNVRGRTVIAHPVMKNLPSHGLVGSISYARGLFRLPRDKREEWMAAYGKKKGTRRKRASRIDREKTNVLAVTAFEQFARCPYRFFARYELGLDSPPEFMGKAYYGTVMHALFAAYTKVRRDGKIDIPTFARTFFDRWREESEVSERDRDPFLTFLALYEEAGIRALFGIEKMLEHSDLVVEDEERAFLITMPNGMKVAGRIDRIDETGAGKLVIDYKTGVKNFASENAWAMRDAQLFFYLASIDQEKRAGAVYLPIVEGKFSGFLAEDDDILHRVEHTLGENLGKNFYTASGARARDMKIASRAEINAVVDLFLSRADRLLRQYVAGDVTAKREKIGGDESCSYCPYEALCGMGEMPFVEGEKISWREFVTKALAENENI